MHAQPAGGAELAGPLAVDLAFEVECAPFVGEVAWDNESGKDEPEEEGVDGKEGAIVKEDTCPADDAGEKSQDCGDGGRYQFCSVGGEDDVGVFEDVEPNE